MSSPRTRTAAESRRRSVLRGAALAVLSPALSTLGSGSAAAAVPTAAPTPDLDGVTLRVLCNSPHVSMYNSVLAPVWKELTGSTLQATPTDYTQLMGKIIDDVQSGTGQFDVFDYYYYMLGSIVDAGALVDLTSWIARERDLNTSDFLPSVYDAYTRYRGRRWGLPYDGDQHLIFYNTELLDAHGQQPPTTWEAYDAAAQAVTEGGDGQYYGTVVTGQPDALVLGCAFINRLVGYGGYLVGSSGRPTLTSPAALAAARHLIDVAPYALPAPTSSGLGTATDAFLAGRAALVETWTGLAQRAADPALSRVVGKWGVTALPLGGRNRYRRTPLEGGYGLGVSSTSKSKDAALAFIKWVTGRNEMLQEVTQKNSAIDPNRTSVLNSSAYAANTPVAVDLIRSGLRGTPMVWPKGPQDPDNFEQLCDNLALAIEGKQSAATALKNAQNAWRP